MSANWIFLIVIGLTIAAYDLIRLFFFGGVHATISWSVYSLNRKYPWVGYILAFGLGVLTWHLVGGTCG